MNLTRQYGRKDEASALTGDRFFTGIDERRSPQQLEEGVGSYGQNLRFRNGRAATRKGVMLCPWMKEDGRTPWTEVYGGIVFSDPNQAGDWFIIAADGGVWKTRPNMVAQVVPLPTGVTLTAATFKQFVANTDGGTGVLVLLRGDEADPLVCLDLDAGFLAVPANSNPGPGMRSMPRSSFGLNHLNRLLLIEGKDIVAASDVLAYNDFVPVQNQYRINPGNSQALVALSPMSNRTLLCYKTQSVLAVLNAANADDGSLTGDGPETVTDSYGLAGPQARTRKGVNEYWMTNEPSLTTLRLTEQNETQDTDVRLSDPMEKTFARVNSLYLDGICVETWDGKIYNALPLDDARVYLAAQAPSSTQIIGADITYLFTVIPGARYRWTQGTAITLSNDEEQLTESGEFTAVTSVVGAGYAGTPANDCQVQRIVAGNTGVAVLDQVTGQWCGVDEAPGVFAVKAFLKTPFLGRQRLFILGADGTLRLYEEGFEDEVLDADGNFAMQPIATTFISRGYQLPEGDRARALSAVARVATWNPRYTLSTLTQGYNSAEPEQEAVTRERAKYDAHAREDWDATNADDDHGTPGRQDYSVVLPAAGFNLGSGVNCDAHQISTARVPLSRPGDWQQIKLTNAQGRLELLNVTVEQISADREGGHTAI